MQREYSNETMRLLYERASCRSFLHKEVPRELLNEIIEAGIHAASGGNLQPYSIINITKEETKKALVEKCDIQPIVTNAPVNLLFCIDWRRTQRWAEASNAPYVATKSYEHFMIAFEDAIICAQNVCTAADSVGLGSVYIGTVISVLKEMKELFDLPEGVFPVVLLSLGYPTKYPEPAKKLGIEGIVHEDKYVELPIEKIMELQNEKYNNKTFPASEANIAQIWEVANDIGGKDYADNMTKSIKEAGFINMAQRYFGLHYCANQLCLRNEELKRYMLENNFTWISCENFPK